MAVPWDSTIHSSCKEVDVEPNEVFLLLMAFGLAPVIVSIGYRVRFVQARLGLGIAYASVIAAYIFSIIDESTQLDVFHLLQHACYAIAGIALLFSALATRRYVTRNMDVDS